MPPEEGFLERFRDAVEAFGGVAKLAQALQDLPEELRKSERTLWRYYGGDTTPTTHWVLEAAEVLGERGEWLLRGEGPRRRISRGGDPWEELREAMRDASIRAEHDPTERFAVAPGVWRLTRDPRVPPHVKQLLVSAMDRYASGAKVEEGRSLQVDTVALLGEQLVTLVFAPFRAWGFEQHQDLSQVNWDYVASALLNLMRIMPVPREGDPFDAFRPMLPVQLSPDSLAALETVLENVNREREEAGEMRWTASELIQDLLDKYLERRWKHHMG